MQAVIFTDLHIHNYKQFNTGTKRLDNCLRVLQDIYAFADGEGTEIILFPGDLFDTFGTVTTLAVVKTAYVLSSLRKKYPHIKIIAIPGNHDMASKNILGNGVTHMLTALEHFLPDNFIVLDKGVPYIIDDAVAIHGVPFYDYKEHFNEALLTQTKAWLNSKELSHMKHYLMVHQTPKGTGNEMIAWDTNPADEVYRNYDCTFCGHIHKKQQIMDDWWLVGSPIHRDFGDVGEKKGFLTIDLLEGPSSIKFHQLEGYPEFTKAYEDEDIAEEAGVPEHFVKRLIRQDSIVLSDGADPDKFNTSLDSIDMVKHFWEVEDGKDADLLAVGISLITHKQV